MNFEMHIQTIATCRNNFGRQFTQLLLIIWKGVIMHYDLHFTFPLLPPFPYFTFKNKDLMCQTNTNDKEVSIASALSFFLAFFINFI
jgi:hypothetical protein